MQRPAYALSLLLVVASACRAGDATSNETGPAPGHSDHGQAFDEGPRQAAYRLKDTGRIKFAITTTSPDAQKFFNQGVGELHGFWYYEAERSFRQAASADPKCAMAYWGMAMANINNVKRAREFLAKAVEFKEGISDREKLWIDALATYYPKDDKREDAVRRRAFVRDLEKIVQEYPKDIEAKAFLVFQIWDNSEKAKMAITSHQAVDSLLDAIFAEEPMHPANHYRIHLWDGENAKRALESAARNGQSAPSIAHMWHMPGHTFSKLDRHDDVAWQQEAAHRVDLAYMMRDHVLPDQIHNFAHNAEWLVRSLNLIGRVHDAVTVSKNLIELPQHPKYNVMGRVQPNGTYTRTSNSSQYGRSRLIDTLIRWEQWDTLVSLKGSIYLDDGGILDEKLRNLHALGLAYFKLNDLANGQAVLAELESIKTEQTASREKPNADIEKKARDEFADAEKKKKPDEKIATLDERIKKAKEDAKAPYNSRIETIENSKTELSIYQALAEGKIDAAKTALPKSKNISKERLSGLYLAVGDTAKAEELAREAVKNTKNQVLPLATLVYTLYRANKMDEARTRFEELRQVAAQTDTDIPAFARLNDCRLQLGFPQDWRYPPLERADSGKRPKLDKLGPLTWTTDAAPSWRLPTGDGREIGLSDYRGKPVVVLFYLGHGCAHCIRQLNAFAPLAKDFEAQGISLVAVGTDNVEGLAKTMAQSKQQGGFPFPLVADPNMRVFHEYRCYDDFEKKPLHGAFLIDADGKTRWWDISYDPFEDTAFLLKEAKRLLKLSGAGPAPKEEVHTTTAAK